MERSERELEAYAGNIVGKAYLDSKYQNTKELAEAVGYDVSTVNKYISTKQIKSRNSNAFTIGTLVDICEALELEMTAEVIKEYI